MPILHAMQSTNPVDFSGFLALMQVEFQQQVEKGGLLLERAALLFHQLLDQLKEKKLLPQSKL